MGNSLECSSPNSNVVTDLSFASIACASNRSELSDEDDREESREDIASEDNDDMQNLTAHSSSEGSNDNDNYEQQRNIILRKIDSSLEREVRFEEGHDTEGKVGTFMMPFLQ